MFHEARAESFDLLFHGRRIAGNEEFLEDLGRAAFRRLHHSARGE